MSALAVWVLTFAVAAGCGIGLWHLRATDPAARPPLWVGVAHGVVGAAGLAALLLALRGPARGVAAGSGSFGGLAAWLFAAALVSGAVMLARRGRGIAVTMAIHSGVAITGYVLLLAWNSLG